MDGIVKLIGGVKRTFDNIIGNDTDINVRRRAGSEATQWTLTQAPNRTMPNRVKAAEQSRHTARRPRVQKSTPDPNVYAHNSLRNQDKPCHEETQRTAHEAKEITHKSALRKDASLRQKTSWNDSLELDRHTRIRIHVKHETTNVHARDAQGPAPTKEDCSQDYIRPGANSLATITSRGANVSESAAKRQKISHELPQNDFNQMSNQDFWNRDMQDQPPAMLARQPSVISLHSQSQETPSQKANAFQHNEIRNVHGTLNNKKKSRKPKPGGTQASSPPHQHGTITDPVSVDDNDDVQILEGPRDPPRSTLQTFTQKSPRVELSSYFSRNTGAPETRIQTKPAVQILDRIEISTPRSPRLDATFVRDDGEPDRASALHQAQPKMRDRMQPVSNTAPTVKHQPVVEDLSEDELSREPAVQSYAQISRRPATQRLPSPNDISPTQFTTKGRRKSEARKAITLSLSSLRMKAGNWQNLHLVYSWNHRLIQFTKNGEMLRNRGAKIIELNMNHARTSFFDLQSSTAVVITGCNDDNSQGRIYLEFATADDRDIFLHDVITDMSPRAINKETEPDKFALMCVNSETFFTPAAKTTDPELEAMSHRQGKSTIRERTMAAQSGLPLPEPASQTPAPRMTRKMKSNYANEPTTKAAPDFSLLPPTPRVDQDTPVRSSRRLKSKDGGKVAQEPEVERWTATHGVPKWSAPLTYPPAGINRTTVDADDIARLDDGELLNDNLISFCLREMQENNPDLKDKAHIFNSFFYSSLTTLPSGKRGFNYDGVKRWTRQIDLFSHPFVAVPINTNFHWFLIIICNLDKLERKLNLDGLGDDEEKPEAEPQPTVEEPTQSQSTVQNDIEIPESPQEVKDDGLSQGVKRISLDASQEEEEEFPPLGKLKPAPRKGKKQAPPLPKMDPDTPALILLDSLSGTHASEIKNLKQYVVHEGRDKRGLEFKYTELRGLTARGLPQQTNFCDCGVYLIGYMEAFLRDPAEFVRKVMSRELDHNNDFADFDPSKKRAEIRERLIKLEEEQSAAKKQKKKEKARLLKMASQDNDSTSQASTPAPALTQMSSPMKPSEAQIDSRMVQSSPMKPPPPPMNKLNSYRSSPYKLSSARGSPLIVERSISDEMLFGGDDDNDNDTNERDGPHSLGNYSHGQNGNTHNQPNFFKSPMNFEDELRQAAQSGPQVDYEEVQ
ncbi:cysteine proteinase [Aureobasidium sp. EXF-10727]|nr:cysteine proteinase [Aureobasidium sp. EXF-10727]